jgi:hypothetical protein
VLFSEFSEFLTYQKQQLLKDHLEARKIFFSKIKAWKWVRDVRNRVGSHKIRLLRFLQSFFCEITSYLHCLSPQQRENDIISRFKAFEMVNLPQNIVFQRGKNSVNFAIPQSIRLMCKIFFDVL